jgi:hypothetical protein
MGRMLKGSSRPCWTDYEDPSKALSRLKQTTTVVACQAEFERLSHQVDNLPEPFRIGCFVGGLQDEIQLEVKLNAQHSLSEARPAPTPKLGLPAPARFDASQVLRFVTNVLAYVTTVIISQAISVLNLI